MESLAVQSPFSQDAIDKLSAGDKVLISGVIYAARDTAHRRMVAALDNGEELPFDVRGQTIYYVGPSPARPGAVIGAAGPTTSGRMDKYTPRLLAAGLAAMLGKGGRSPEVMESIKKHKAVYFATIGGAGALLAEHIKKADVIAYEDLGAEAILRLEVENFPAVVAADSRGGDIFREGPADFRKPGGIR
jgi:fumarate hydratase subunit beta